MQSIVLVHVSRNPPPTPCLLLFLLPEITSTLTFVDLGEGEIAGEERGVMMGMREGEKEKNIARGGKG